MDTENKGRGDVKQSFQQLGLILGTSAFMSDKCEMDLTRVIR